MAMPRGKHADSDSKEDKKAIRREKVRLNVQAYRERKRAGVKVRADLRWVANTRLENEYDHQRRQSTPSSNSQFGLPAGRSFETPDQAHDSCSTTVARGNQVILPSLLMSPSPAKGYSLALLALFPKRFLPTRVSLPDSDDIGALRTPCALWVTTAAKQARELDSGALNDIIHSVVLATVGMEQGSDDIMMYARRLYSRGLAKTREDIQFITNKTRPKSETRILDLFLSCHAATVYELLVNGSMRDMLRHVLGIGILIEHQRLLPNFPRLIGGSLLEEYRILEIHFCLLQRRLSTTSRLKNMATTGNISPDQVNVNAETGIVGSLLDLADQILPLLVDLDTYRGQISATEAQLATIAQKASALHYQLDAWSEYLCDRTFSDVSGSQPPIRTIRVDVTRITHYEYAFCYLYSLSYDLHAIETWVEAIATLDYRRNSTNTSMPKDSAQALALRTKLLCIAGSMLELMPYFLQDDKGIIGRSMPIWPLEVVWSMLERESERSRWDDAICSLTPLSNELKHKQEKNKETIAKYFKMCRAIVQTIRGYGLSLFVEREMI